ncbi:MAG: nucleotidyltransferase domain-containing protein [bacterium]|jgi:predicted nucleotidyltransferase
MRISDLEKKILISQAKKHFGENARIYLFGSRAYDDRKGGDIDLFIETDKDVEKLSEYKFITGFHRLANERKIDLILKTPSSELKPIQETAKKEGILLC